MNIIIMNQSELPIYAQIAGQIKEQILSGAIPEGTVLPSIRKLAKETGVSVITTTRAYNELTEAGFIASIQGKGCVVLPQDNEVLREQYLKRIESGLETAIAAAKAIRMDRTGIEEMLNMLWETEEE